MFWRANDQSHNQEHESPQMTLLLSTPLVWLGSKANHALVSKLCSWEQAVYCYGTLGRAVHLARQICRHTHPGVHSCQHSTAQHSTVQGEQRKREKESMPSGMVHWSLG